LLWRCDDGLRPILLAALRGPVENGEVTGAEQIATMVMRTNAEKLCDLAPN